MKAPVPTLQLSLLDALAAAQGSSTAPHKPVGTPAGQVKQSTAVVLQPDLPLDQPRSAVTEEVRAALEVKLQADLGPAVKLTVTDNRRTMVSVRRRGGVRHVRLHHMFTDAPTEVVSAVALYLADGDREASKLIDRYIAANQSKIRTHAFVQPAKLIPRGAVYDLEEIQHGLSERYFAGRVRLNITWGRRGKSRSKRNARRTIRMGTYFIDEQLIRIHPALDQAFVPRYFVEWVVYHEMLHHVIPMPVVNGRRIYHSAEFRESERRFADYERARAWEQAHLRRLIGSRNVAATT